MKNVLAVLDKLLHPPKWVLLTLPPIVFAALTYVLLKGRKSSTLTYMIYCMSAFCLTIWILPLPRLFRKAKANTMHRLTGTVFGGKYIGDLVKIWWGHHNNLTENLYMGGGLNVILMVNRIEVGV